MRGRAQSACDSIRIFRGLNFFASSSNFVVTFSSMVSGIKNLLLAMHVCPALIFMANHAALTARSTSPSSKSSKESIPESSRVEGISLSAHFFAMAFPVSTEPVITTKSIFESMRTGPDSLDEESSLKISGGKVSRRSSAKILLVSKAFSEGFHTTPLPATKA